MMRGNYERDARSGLLLPRGLRKLERPAFLCGPGLLAGGGITTTYVQAVTADAPVHWWRLNEASGTSAADSGSTPTAGTYTGAVTLNQTGMVKAGASCAFPGGSVFMDTNVTTAYTSICCIEIWINPTSASVGSNAPHFFTKNSYYAVSQTDFPIALVWSPSSDGNVHFRLSSGANFSYTTDLTSGVLAAGNPYHIVGRYQANTMADLWVNGQQVASTTINYTIPTGTQHWHVGAATDNAGGAGGSGFVGKLEEAAIYNTLLSGARISAHYNSRNN